MHRAMHSSLWGDARPPGALLLYTDWLLHSTLGPAGCALHDLARLALLPAASTPSLARRLADAATQR